jgi:hypothetical protein
MNTVEHSSTAVPANKGNYQSISFQEAIKQVGVSPEAVKATEQITIADLVKKPYVARYLTFVLIWLFAFQVGVMTLAYILLIFLDKNLSDVLTRSTQAILDGVKTILPVTTTFLGVAIGFYFRDTEAREEAPRKVP